LLFRFFGADIFLLPHLFCHLPRSVMSGLSLLAVPPPIATDFVGFGKGTVDCPPPLHDWVVPYSLPKAFSPPKRYLLFVFLPPVLFSFFFTPSPQSGLLGCGCGVFVFFKSAFPAPSFVCALCGGLCPVFSKCPPVRLSHDFILPF